MVHTDLIEKAYSDYLNAKGSRWKLANGILYDMCKKHPKHIDADEIVAKIWLIGRSYAAAIERRKNAKSFTGDFYYDVVAPSILAVGLTLDQKINAIKPPLDDTSIKSVLDTHGYLTSIFESMTDMDKRSLASKYLHFHCPNMFFIYDSRASAAIVSLVKKDGEKVARYTSSGRDDVYTDFCVRALELRAFIELKYKAILSPRELDDFLLYFSDNKSRYIP